MAPETLNQKLINLETKLLSLQQFLPFPELKDAIVELQKVISTKEEPAKTAEVYEPPVYLIGDINVPQIYTDLYQIDDSWKGCQNAIAMAMTYDRVDNDRFFATLDNFLNKYSEQLMMSGYLFRTFESHLERRFGSRGLDMLYELVIKSKLEIPDDMHRKQYFSFALETYKKYLDANKVPNALFVEYYDVIQNQDHSDPRKRKMQSRESSEKSGTLELLFRLLHQSLYEKLDPKIISYAESKGWIKHQDFFPKYKI
jgi:hypothetical protein